MKPGHTAVNQKTHPMKIHADSSFRMLSAPLPLTSGNTPVMHMCASGYRFLSANVALCCHKRKKFQASSTEFQTNLNIQISNNTVFFFHIWCLEFV